MSNNKYLKEYKAPDFCIDTIDLNIEIGESITKVKSRLSCKRLTDDPATLLVLDGINLRLLEVLVDGNVLMEKDYVLTDKTLEINNLPSQFVLETVVEISPVSNLSLSGLYMSNGNYCTQCEAEGFRRITYFLDRPDVMSVYTCKIIADIDACPVLLSNGNLIDSGTMPGGKHWVKWYDPSKKPSYLFALVAGNFEVVSDEFITMSNRRIQLDVFVEPGKLSQASFALNALQKAMLWDENVYKREYDLDRYMIVAVSDFNFGAMENKGLNIFNDKYILANPKTATDYDFLGVETVVGHEYFHNWTGNRITLANWFQLCLKEGLTVFREQSFAADITSFGLRRIEAALIIENAQFAEDLGPMSHAVRPDSFVEINNFYTVTVYNKGAEVARMLQTLLGEELFLKGMHLYFNRFDGKAITIEDFLSVMAEVNGQSLEQFKLWYTDPGVVELTAIVEYDADSHTCFVEFSQKVLNNKLQNERVVPIKIGFLSSQGKQQVKYEGKLADEHLLVLKSQKQRFEFNDVKYKPICSILRDFSAPVKLNYSLDKNAAFDLLKHDADAYVIWRTWQNILINFIKNSLQNEALDLDSEILLAYKNILYSKNIDYAEIVKVLTMPTANYVLQYVPNSDIVKIAAILKKTSKSIAKHLCKEFVEMYSQLKCEMPFQYNYDQVKIRSMKNFCLQNLALANYASFEDVCNKQYQTSDNMTEQIGVINAVVKSGNIELQQKLFDDFYAKWQNDSLLVDKWLACQAVNSSPNALELINELCKHESFSWLNPNRVRSLIGVFCANNILAFHDVSGEGYQFLANSILKVDEYNSQLAARLCQPFLQLSKLDHVRCKVMKNVVVNMYNENNLSSEVKEIINKVINF